MSIRVPLFVSILLLGIMAAASLWGFSVIPEHARVAVHWSFSGRPNGFAGRDTALILFPAIAAAMTAFLAMLPRIEPRRANLIASRKLYLSAWIGALAVLTLVHLLIVATAMGMAVDIRSGVLAGVSLFIIVIGNFMGKSHSTFLAGGLRLPWTLTSEYAWEKSNRLAGRMFVATGIVTLATVSLGGTVAALAIFVAGIGLATVAGTIAAYICWRHDPNRQTGDRMPE